jgi:hypothetical protein
MKICFIGNFGWKICCVRWGGVMNPPPEALFTKGRKSLFVQLQGFGIVYNMIQDSALIHQGVKSD